MRKLFLGLALLGLTACQPAGMRLGDGYHQSYEEYEDSYGTEFESLNLFAGGPNEHYERDFFYNDDQQTRSKASNSSNEPSSETYLA